MLYDPSPIGVGPLVSALAKPITGFSIKVTGVGVLLFPGPSLSGSTFDPFVDVSVTVRPLLSVPEAATLLL